MEQGAQELVGGPLNLLGQGGPVGVRMTGERGGKVEEGMKTLESTGTEGAEGCLAALLELELGFGGVGGHWEEAVEECHRALPH